MSARRAPKDPRGGAADRGARGAGPKRAKATELDVAIRASALQDAIEAATGRVDDAVLDRARDALAQTRDRGELSPEHTVVALAGATGSGKSSLINALAGAQVATAGIRRPTTAVPTAAIWGPPADELLDWLGVGTQHTIAGEVPAILSGTAALAVGRDVVVHQPPAGGLVVLDLPDHDSVVSGHRVVAEHIVERADLLVWVLDPQKYADAALHERYLRPLARHAESMVLVLNHSDRLTPDEVLACLADLARLAADDGLGKVRILATSTRTGEGIAELGEMLARAARARSAARARLITKLQEAAGEVVRACEASGPGHSTSSDAAEGDLLAALASAAGIDQVVHAVRGRALAQARAHTGWPPLRWMGRFRPDPLRRLNLLRGPEQTELARTSLPLPAAGHVARVQVAVRAYTHAMTAGAPTAWVLAARERVEIGAKSLPDRLDQAVAATDLNVNHRPVWWRAVNAWQWLVTGAMVAGLGWLGLLAALAYFHLPEPATPSVGTIPWPTVLALGGAIVGVVTALVARGVSSLGARRAAARARVALSRAIAGVASESVRAPLLSETDALDRARACALIAAGP